MYSKEKVYKFHIENDIFYTGKVIDEDDINISIETQRGESLVLTKDRIIQAKVIE